MDTKRKQLTAKLTQNYKTAGLDVEFSCVGNRLCILVEDSALDFFDATLPVQAGFESAGAVHYDADDDLPASTAFQYRIPR